MRLIFADHAPQAGLGLLHLADLIDQSERLGPVRIIGAALEGLQQLLRVLPAVLGRGPDLDGVNRAHIAQGRFFVGGSEVVIEEGIDGVLVFVALFERCLQAVAIEKPFEEHGLRRHAHRLKTGLGLHPELVGAGAHHIGGAGKAGRVDALAMGDHQLARATEMADRAAHLVGDGGGHAPFRQTDEQGLDAAVALGGAQSLDDLGHRQGVAGQEGERGMGRLVGYGRAQVQGQDRIGGRLRRAGAGKSQQHDSDGQNDEEQREGGENPRHGEEELLQDQPSGRSKVVSPANLNTSRQAASGGAVDP